MIYEDGILVKVLDFSNNSVNSHTTDGSLYEVVGCDDNYAFIIDDRSDVLALYHSEYAVYNMLDYHFTKDLKDLLF